MALIFSVTLLSDVVSCPVAPAVKIYPPCRVVKLSLKFPFMIRLVLVLDHGAVSAGVNRLFHHGNLGLEVIDLSF